MACTGALKLSQHYKRHQLAERVQQAIEQRLEWEEQQAAAAAAAAAAQHVRGHMAWCCQLDPSAMPVCVGFCWFSWRRCYDCVGDAKSVSYVSHCQCGPAVLLLYKSHVWCRTQST
jgi:hypothetical protein